MQPRHHVVIVGGGFSGVALAAQLLPHARENVRITLVEQGARLGRGIAYGSPSDAHVLNTRAEQMSLLADQPEHFVRWLAQSGRPAQHADFVPRHWYGEYVEQTLLDVLRSAAGGALFAAHLQTRVLDVEPTGSGFRVTLGDGARLQCDTLVLATGQAQPADPLARWLSNPAPRYRRNPWEPGLLDAIGPSDRVLLLGTGLTMVDVALGLAARRHTGVIHAVSRRGLLPRVHTQVQQLLPRDLHDALAEAAGAETLREVVRRLRSVVARADARGVRWHAVFDAFRPFASQLWMRLCAADRQRFVRWLRPFWDVHRHRLAPQPAAALEALHDQGRLSVRAARIAGVSSRDDALIVAQRLRGSTHGWVEAYDWIVNCTGPQFGRETSSGLERRLLEGGLLLPDPLGLGFITGPAGEAIGRLGVRDGLYVLGPACRAMLWEHTSVPELRAQAQALASILVRRAARQTPSGVEVSDSAIRLA